MGEWESFVVNGLGGGANGKLSGVNGKFFPNGIIQFPRHRHLFVEPVQLQFVTLRIAVHTCYIVQIDQVTPVTPEELRKASEHIIRFLKGLANKMSRNLVILFEVYLDVIIGGFNKE